MLSLAKLTSSTGASTYFEVDDYYTKEEAQAEIQKTTSFHGKIAEEMHLKPFVEKEKFKELLDGIVHTLNGKQELGNFKKDSEKQRCAGTDMTFSAPKSMSILAETMGKDKLTQIHEIAVKTTLDYIEKHFITTQIREGSSSDPNSTVHLEQTTKALFATFRHNTSRNLDPQMHTHAIAINITRRDGEIKYRSTEFKKIFENKMLLGAIYRGELANSLMKEGYEIEQKNIDGRFEIKGFSQDLIDKFSTRRAEIEAILEKLDLNNAKISSQITLQTRGKKIKTPKSILKDEWAKTTIGYNISNLDNNKNQDRNYTVHDLIQNSINVILEGESAFKKEDIFKQTLINNVEKGITIKEIEQSFDSMVKDKEIIKQSGDFYTTKSAIYREMSIIRHLDNNHHIRLFNNKEELNNLINNKKYQTQYNLLTTGQKDAINLILTSNKQIIGIQGSAGTGKTYMLDLTRQLLATKDMEFIALAPSSSATKLLKDDAKIQNHHTLQHFITRYARYQNNTKLEDFSQTKSYFANKVIILDESSLVSSKQMLTLLNISKTLDIKLVLQGDAKQLAAVEAGKPFAQMQKAGMETAIMNDILRQKDPTLKQAVEMTITNNIKQAFQKLGNNIIEINTAQTTGQTNIDIGSYALENTKKEHSHLLDDKTEEIQNTTQAQLVAKTIETYFNLPTTERNKTLVLTPANETRTSINNAIRQELKNRCELNLQKQMMINSLKLKNFTSFQKSHHSSFEKDDIMIFNQNIKTLGIRKNDEMKVIDRDRNSIVLENKDGKRILWHLETQIKKTEAFDLYTKEEKEILQNEKIRFTKNDKTHKFINSHTAEVIGINNKTNEITLKLDNNTKTKINADHLKHFDYAYSSTAYASQGKTTNNVIAILESYRKNLTSQQTFYVEISRAKNQAFLITDNKEQLIKTLEKQTGEKLSAIQIKDNREMGALMKQRDFENLI